jgi:hypothetical protein
MYWMVMAGRSPGLALSGGRILLSVLGQVESSQDSKSFSGH